MKALFLYGMLSHILKSEKKVERDVDPRATAVVVPDLAEVLGGDETMLRGKKRKKWWIADWIFTCPNPSEL